MVECISRSSLVRTKLPIGPSNFEDCTYVVLGAMAFHTRKSMSGRTTTYPLQRGELLGCDEK